MRLRSQNNSTIVKNEFLDEQFRLKLVQNLGVNTCAIVILFDMLRGSDFLKYIQIWKQDCPQLIPVLRWRPKNYETHKYELAYNQLRSKIRLSLGIQLLGELQDPFYLLQVTKRFLLGFNKHYILEPIIQHDCNGYQYDNPIQTIKMFGKEITIIEDAAIRRRVKGGMFERNQVLNEGDWSHYIIMYSKNVTQNLKPPKDFQEYERIDSRDIQRHYTGGMHQNNRSLRGQRIVNQHLKQKSIKLVLSNVCSLRKEMLRKKQYLFKALDPGIACLIEARIMNVSMKNYISYQCVPSRQVNEINKQNVCILVRNDLISKQISKGTNWIAIQLLLNKRKYLIIGLYVHYSCKDREKLQDLCEQLNYTIENYEDTNEEFQVILCGDFNLTKEQIKAKRFENQFFQKLANLNSRYMGKTSKRSDKQIDHMFYSDETIELEKDDYFIQGGLSDHSILVANIKNSGVQAEESTQVLNKKFSRQMFKKMLISKPNKTKYLELCQQLIKQNIRPFNLICKDQFSQRNSKVQIIRQIEKPEFQVKYLDKYQKELEKIIDGQRKNKGRFFKDLDRITGYKAVKKEGGLMKRAILNGQIISGDLLDQKIVEHYKEINCGRSSNIFVEPPLFQNMNIDQIKIIRATKNINFGKAAAYDLLPDEIFKLTKSDDKERKMEWIKMFLSSEFWMEHNNLLHLDARMITLNKSYPKIPQLSEYRPIIIASPIIKLLEGLIINKLKNYCNEQLIDTQFGFRKGKSIEMCKRLLIKKSKDLINISKSSSFVNKAALVFIDFRMAYDKLSRQKTYERIRLKRILNQQQIKLLQFIHYNIRVRKGSHSMYTSQGMPQGLTSSPFLFNIGIEGLQQQLNKQKIQHIFFADDLVMMVNNLRIANKGMQIIQNWCEDHKMQLNKKKSAILPLGRRIKWLNIPNEYRELPVVRQYKYLGTIVNFKMSIQNQLGTTKSKCLYVIKKLTGIRKFNNNTLNLNMFKVIIEPQFNNLTPFLMNRSSKSDEQKIMTLRKKLFKMHMQLTLNCPNKLLDDIIGCQKRLSSLAETQQFKLQCHETQTKPNGNYIYNLKFKSQIKRIPNLWRRTINCISGHNKNKIIITEKEVEKYWSIKLELGQTLKLYQIKDHGSQIRNKLKSKLRLITKKLNDIKR